MAMDYPKAYFDKKREAARKTFFAQASVRCPYFGEEVVFNSDGFHHLQFSARHERSHGEQLLKFFCLSYGIDIIKHATTAQEYRKILQAIGEPSRRDGSVPMKEVEYWGFVGILKHNSKEEMIKVRVIVRKVGTGKYAFWSVMPVGKKLKDQQQKLFKSGIEDV